MKKSCEHYPKHWTQGQLLGFSGIDGDSAWGQALILHTGDTPFEFDIKLPLSVRFGFSVGGKQPTLSQLTSDVAYATLGDSEISLQFNAAGDAGGHLPPAAQMLVDGVALAADEVRLVRGESTNIGFFRSGNRWAVTLRAHEDELEAAGRELLVMDWAEVRTRRNKFLDQFRYANVAPEYRSLLAKSLSVMKVNTESAGGTLPCRWSTPDRWPHRSMWLWDSAFHAVGMAAVDLSLAADFMESILNEVDENGFLCHRCDPDGYKSQITQPPILGWALSKLVERGFPVDALRQNVERNHSFLRWCVQNRDSNGNGLPEWAIRGDHLCRSGESGMDNSPRFDCAVEMDAPDFSAFLANDFACTSALAEQLGMVKIAADCMEARYTIAEQVNKLLWNEQTGFYHDRLMSGALTDIKAVSGFMPLFAGIADPSQAEKLVAHLTNQDTFGTPFPVPSVSLDHGTFSKDMWRGPTWINMNYLIVEGLRRYDFVNQAETLRQKTLGEVLRWYQQEGCLFEYYDCLSLNSPRNLDRKQRLARGEGDGPISDYHWTAALTAALILQTN